MDDALDNSTASGVLLSIITVTRDDADRLSKTIESLFDFYGDARYEHIVVDGGSIDHTAQVISSLADTPNFRFDSDFDEGIYDAMNKGAEKSCGRFQLFLNCGDRMLAKPDELAVCLHEIEHKPVYIMCFDFVHVDRGSCRLVKSKKVKRYKLPTSHQGMVFLTSFVRAHLYDTRYKIAADYDLYLHAQPSQVTLASVEKPLTAVEINGVASSNPVISYKEYLLIALRNLHGVEMLACLICISFRALVVIPMKLLLPLGWIEKMRLKV